MATYNGTAGNEWLYGGTGDDVMDGGDGNDFLNGVAGNDSITGGAGNDVLFSGPGNDTLDGGTGVDAVDYSFATGGVTVNLAQGTASGFGSDILRNIENVTGGPYADMLIGDASSNKLLGDFGNDTLTGGAGSDQFQLRYISTDTSVDTITDFTAAFGGDNLQIPTFEFTNYTSGANPFASGHAKLVQRGADTLLQVDIDGPIGAKPFETIAILQNVTKADLVADNLDGFDPNAIGGTAGADFLTGTSGNDQIVGGAGNDTISGLAGNDALYGEAGDDVIDGGDGNDKLDGGDGNDNMTAGVGEDQLYGGLGNDTLTGGAGTDVFYFRYAGDTSVDTITDFAAGAGGDNIHFSATGFVNFLTDINPFASGVARLTESGNDTLLEVDPDGPTGGDVFRPIAILQNVAKTSLVASNLNGWDSKAVGGTTGDDFLTGTAGNDCIYGLAGNDTINGLSGDDKLYGGAGDDVLNGGDGSNMVSGDDGNDSITGGAGNDYLFGNAGNDIITGGAGYGNLYGGTGDDVIICGDGSNAVWGGDGDDSITGGVGRDYLHGDAGNDSITGGAGSDYLNGGLGNDTLNGGADIDIAYFSGTISDYYISYNRNLGTATITDHRVGGDGIDNLISIEGFQFSDKTFDLVNPPRKETPSYGKTSSFLFDAAYYLLKNPELVPSVTLATAYDNYRNVGATAGDAPNSWFDPVYYANKWADLKALNLDAATLFMHYNLYGVWEGRSAGPTFDTYDGDRYLTDNPDVADYVDAYVADFLGSRSNGAIAHYVIYGTAEGRHAYDLSGHPIDPAILIGVAG